VRELLVFYPCDSLSRQIVCWARRHIDSSVELTFARTARDIQRYVHTADTVLVDATHDYAQAADTFSLALTHLGASRTALYTERMHDGLEPFARVQGSLLLFGPLPEVQWDEYLERALPRDDEPRRWRRAA
jgi:hypothetical protein